MDASIVAIVARQVFSILRCLENYWLANEDCDQELFWLLFYVEFGDFPLARCYLYLPTLGRHSQIVVVQDNYRIKACMHCMAVNVLFFTEARGVC